MVKPGMMKRRGVDPSTVWAHNSSAGHTNPDWKCSNFGKFSISWGRHYKKMLRANYVHWGSGAHNSGLEMFKFFALSGADWACIEGGGSE